MLHNVVITSLSGVIKFKKDFLNPIRNINIVCGIIVTQVKKAKNDLSQTISYIEMQNSAVTIVDDASSNLLCICFHDVEDGWQFGKLLATQILLKFIQEAQRKSASNVLGHHNLPISQSVTNSKTITLTGQMFGSYTGRVGPHGALVQQQTDDKDEPVDYKIDQQVFNSKIPEAFRSMVNPVLKYLNKQRGVKHASLITSGNVLQSTNSDLSLTANLKILNSHTTDLMNSALDHPQMLRIEGETTTIQVIQVEHLTHLVVLCLKNADRKFMDAIIFESVTLLKKSESNDC
ncbi:adenylosuccinate synthetase [Acrasis kona]|uniref:Adenylosuccinate synthetase n=1 Tax=Acrasis kona TaxID=1008807 RepID=A0AAW2ZHK2_9EUKA